MCRALKNVPADLANALIRCDALCGAEQLDYYYELYDPKTGGFYYSISSRDTEGMTPFSEGTSFTLEALSYGGIGIPEWEKEKVTAWIRGHQDEADGFFYEDLWGKITSGPRLNRDLRYSVDILDRCGVKPLYALPSERIRNNQGNSTIPAYLSSESAMLEYLDSLDWSYDGIWLTGQKISTASEMIDAAGLGDMLREYLLKKINPQTGLFADGLGWMNTNGTMKLSRFFDTKFPYPNISLAIDSVISIFENSPPPSVSTHIWNPFVFLERAIKSQGEGSEAARTLLYEKGAKIVNVAVERALKLKKADGGFSSYPERAAARQQGYLYGLGLPTESDLDGTLIAGPRLRDTIYSVFGIKADNEYYKQYEEEFWEKCRRKAPIVKKFPRPKDQTIGPRDEETMAKLANARCS